MCERDWEKEKERMREKERERESVCVFRKRGFYIKICSKMLLFCYVSLKDNAPIATSFAKNGWEKRKKKDWDCL